MKSCLDSFYEDIDAGFELLHIDVSRDWHYNDRVNLETAVQRTIIILNNLENYRKQNNINKIIYEISLEETGNENCTVDEFEHYVKGMMGGFKKVGIETFPKIIVGNTGTFVRMDQNVGKY